MEHPILALIWVLACGHLTTISVSLYLHRHLTHRSIELGSVARHLMRAWLWIMTGMVSAEWRAVHLAHHADPDGKNDPHSPRNHGLLKVLLLGVRYYQKALKDQELLYRYKGGPRDWLEEHVYARHRVLGVLLLALADIALFGLSGMIVWVAQVIWIPAVAAGVINGLGHSWGTRPYRLKEDACNIHILTWPVLNLILGLFTAGEEWHNHHHHSQSSARFSRHWWQADWGYWYLRVLSALGLARVST